MPREWPENPRCSLRDYQRIALGAVAQSWQRGLTRALVVLPPGSGKTLVGLTAAAQLGRPTLILSPNTAIQMQWVAQWEAEFAGPGSPRISTDRSLSADLTSLTYQAIANFNPEGEAGEEGNETGSQTARLSPRARELVADVSALGPATLVLDEAHHLVQVWGELLAEVLSSLPDIRVIGLTATPSEALTADQVELTDRLLGPPVATASIPALVKQGFLAPYSELAWLCEPTPAEADWLREDGLRFAELQSDLVTPGVASTDFFVWLDAYVGRMSGADWLSLTSRRPELARAIMRFHHAELVGIPARARVREEYRQHPRAEDWGRVIGEFVREVLVDSVDERDVALLSRLHSALPSVGFTLGATGVRRGRSPVDRVVARSAAKTAAAVEIVAAEYTALGEQLRALVVVDHERATATLPARLVGVIAEQAGSAVLVAEELVADPRLADLGIALVTGKTVAVNAVAAGHLRSVRPTVATTAGDGLMHVSDAWSPREWVPTLTRLFEAGEIAVLVGTRGLLGEGWDARSVTTLIDLSTATTATSVVQTRGRTLRLDPHWSAKVAHTWSVVCVAPEHARGLGDYDRFVAKHAGYFGLNADGQVVAGVSHVAAGLSPFLPPAAATFDAFNAGMLLQAERREDTRTAWEIGGKFHDRVVPAVQVTPEAVAAELAGQGEASGFAGSRRGKGGGPLVSPVGPGSAEVPAVLPTSTGISRNHARPPGTVLVLLSFAALAAILVGLTTPLVGIGLGLLTVGLAGATWVVGGRRALADYQIASAVPGVADYAAVIAEALGSAEEVRIRVREGVTTVDLPGPRAQDFATALDEILSAPGDPRYVVARPVLPQVDSKGTRKARRAARGRLEPPIVCHAVPTVFGVRSEALKPFTTAWQRRIAVTDPRFTGSPEGAGLLAGASPDSPAELATGVRVVWD